MSWGRDARRDWHAACILVPTTDAKGVNLKLGDDMKNVALSDETYAALQSLAASRNFTPDELVRALIDDGSS